ncbi:hypothetical protein K435DRAFT_596761, partial [Dendrothele bispora CBS 962.96]
VTAMLGLVYLSVLVWFFRMSILHPRTFTKDSGVKIQRFAPFGYIFLVLSALVEVAFSTWLLLQYRFHHNFPNVEFRTGTRMTLFSACWTVVTGGAYSFLFIHPTWSKTPIASVGSQSIWVVITWVLWIISAGLLNRSLPSLFIQGVCTTIVYCGQIRSLFG